MSLSAFQLKQDLEPETCINCGVLFGIPASLQRQRIRDHYNIWCPNGHTQHYPGKSDVERLEELLATQKQRLNLALQRENEERTRADKLAKAAALHKKRIVAGVCPCCTRTFKQLAAHMKTKHPEYIDGQQ